MKPILFSGSWLETPTYFLFYFGAFLVAILLAARRAPSYQLSAVRAVDLGLIVFVFGFIGARIFHILFEEPAYYLENPLRVFYFWQGGFVLFGGILLAIAAAFIFLRRKGESIGSWADLAAPSMLLGIGIGRMACLANACCYGSVTDWWWGIMFTNPQAAAPLHVYLHPTQTLEIFFGLTATFVFLRILANPPKLKASGFAAALVSYSVFRFFVEFLRGDEDRGLYFSGAISSSQIIALGVILACLIWYWRAKPTRHRVST